MNFYSRILYELSIYVFLSLLRCSIQNYFLASVLPFIDPKGIVDALDAGGVK